MATEPRRPEFAFGRNFDERRLFLTDFVKCIQKNLLIGDRRERRCCSIFNPSFTLLSQLRRIQSHGHNCEVVLFIATIGPPVTAALGPSRRDGVGDAAAPSRTCINQSAFEVELHCISDKFMSTGNTLSSTVGAKIRSSASPCTEIASFYPSPFVPDDPSS